MFEPIIPEFLNELLWFNMQLQVLENPMKITETFLTGDILQPAASEVAIAQDAQEDGKIFLKKLPDPPKRHKETVHLDRSIAATAEATTTTGGTATTSTREATATAETTTATTTETTTTTTTTEATTATGSTTTGTESTATTGSTESTTATGSTTTGALGLSSSWGRLGLGEEPKR